jgi:hypothetical protein
MDDASVTCIKLAPITYALTSTLRRDFGHYTQMPLARYNSAGLESLAPLAIVAEEGQATLDGGGSVLLMFFGPGVDVALANLVLRNGSSSSWNSLPCHPWRTYYRLSCGYDGGIVNYGTMALETCVFEYNKARYVRLRRPS